MPFLTAAELFFSMWCYRCATFFFRGCVTAVVVATMMLSASVRLQAVEPAIDSSKPGEAKRVHDGFDVSASDWPWWRGPQRNGTANPDQSPPLHFSATENVVWKSPVPGRGYGSPTVCGPRVFLATSDEDTGSQSMLCFDRNTGRRLWTTEVHASGGMRKNNRSTAASSTAACDGQRLYINFPNSDALITTALDVDGNIVWQHRVSDYVIHQGYGASPALYQHMVIVSSDNKSGGAVAALDRETGQLVWRRDRPQTANYPSPILLNSAGRDQLIMVGCDMIVSYDPLTGETNWETEGATTECVTSTVTDGQLVYTSGGYPRNHMSALKADGSGRVVWENTERLYVPSLLVRGQYLFGVLDAGIAMCWQADTGREMWKARLGGNFSSSPVLVGDRVYATNEEGTFFIFRASPEQYELLAKSHLGEEVLATPTIVDSRIYHRVAHRDENGLRQEMLYCLGE